MSDINILGISAYFHDSAAALIQNGKIISAAQEERFTRKKHDPSFPFYATESCLHNSGLTLADIQYVVFYDKPLLKFERILETYLNYAPTGFTSFIKSMPIWLKEKLYLKKVLKQELQKLTPDKDTELPKLLFSEHHKSHAASAFYPSPFPDAAVLCLDGVGEWATSSVWYGQDNKLESKWSINFPHSLGLLYSAFTYYIGFKVNSGEYKLMALAPYGEPKYVNLILDNLIDVKADGSFKMNMDYFAYPTGLTMTNKRFHDLFGRPPRTPETSITQFEMDIAKSIQVVTEEIVLRIVNNVHADLNTDNLCLAGGVALNCVANGRILRESKFKNIWIQPAAGDAGGAIGAALAVWHEYLKRPRTPNKADSMHGSYLGNKFSNDEIKKELTKIKAKFHELPDTELLSKTAQLIADGNVVGWFQGRMEFGPRALGGRSILGDPRSSKMQSIMNKKIKFRESFRPFAPAVLKEKVANWFELTKSSPYMLLVAPLKAERCCELTSEQQKLFGIAKLNIPRSEIPAITHVDYSARVQTVDKTTNPRFYSLIKEFDNLTGCPVLINTSFNIRGEPIVCSPLDAYRCFINTNMDYLILENIFLAKTEQPQDIAAILGEAICELD